MNIAELGRLKSLEHRLTDIEARLQRLEHHVAELEALRSLVTDLRVGVEQLQET